VGQLTEVAADPAAQLPPEDLVIEADADGAGFWGFVRVHDLVSMPAGSEWSPPLVTVINPCLQSVDTLPDTLMGVVRAWEILQQAGVGFWNIYLLMEALRTSPRSCWNGILSGTLSVVGSGTSVVVLMPP